MTKLLNVLENRFVLFRTEPNPSFYTTFIWEESYAYKSQFKSLPSVINELIEKDPFLVKEQFEIVDD